jgi:hypothetical protein
MRCSAEQVQNYAIDDEKKKIDECTSSERVIDSGCPPC